MLVLHVNQEHMTPIQSLHHQAISNLSMHAGRRESQWLPGKYLHSVNIGTNGSNGGVRIRPPRATMMVSPPIIDESDVIFRDILLFHPPIYPEVRPKGRNWLLGGFFMSTNRLKVPVGAHPREMRWPHPSPGGMAKKIYNRSERRVIESAQMHLHTTFKHIRTFDYPPLMRNAVLFHFSSSSGNSPFLPNKRRVK